MGILFLIAKLVCGSKNVRNGSSRRHKKRLLGLLLSSITTLSGVLSAQWHEWGEGYRMARNVASYRHERSKQVLHVVTKNLNPEHRGSRLLRLLHVSRLVKVLYCYKMVHWAPYACGSGCLTLGTRCGWACGRGDIFSISCVANCQAV